MQTSVAARCAALLATGAAASLLTLPALAHRLPGDTGAGVERGIQELNNSGQVGTVTLFEHARDSLVFVQIHGAPRAELVRLVRGPGCDNLAPGVAFVVSDLRGGASQSLVHARIDRLLSGNYNVVVFGSTSRQGGPVACGHLYAR